MYIMLFVWSLTAEPFWNAKSIFTDFLCSVLLTGSDKKVEYNLLRTRTISTDDIISPNFKIYALNGGKEYRVSIYCRL